jgi:hypothetical protein
LHLDYEDEVAGSQRSGKISICIEGTTGYGKCSTSSTCISNQRSIFVYIHTGGNSPGAIFSALTQAEYRGGDYKHSKNRECREFSHLICVEIIEENRTKVPGKNSAKIAIFSKVKRTSVRF